MNVAVITGAANGIGLALSLIHLQKGHAVVLLDNDAARLAQQSELLSSQFPNRVSSLTCDVCNEEQVLEAAKQIKRRSGRVDFLYNNAGIIGDLAPVWDLNTSQISRVMDVNLYGMIHMIKAFCPILFQQDFRSKIINMASLYALCSGSQLAAYSMSKHAVLALSESLHYDLMRLEKPVDVCVVFPSFTDTALLTHSSDASNTFHESLKSLLTHSRPALDVARYVVEQVETNCFYILPDKEVKGYCEERIRPIINQDAPHINNIEKLMSSLIRRRASRKDS